MANVWCKSEWKGPLIGVTLVIHLLMTIVMCALDAYKIIPYYVAVLLGVFFMVSHLPIGLFILLVL